MKNRALKAGDLMIAGLLGLAVMVSAVFVVKTKHENRRLVNEQAELRTQSEQLNTEWSQLQLEEATLANNSRIEQIARQKLSMTEPKSPVIVRTQQR